MNKRSVERKVANSFEHAAPDVYQTVSAQCPARAKAASRKNTLWGWKFATCALALALVVAIVFGGVALGGLNGQTAVAASVTLDVNPSVSLQISGHRSQDYRVVNAEALNDDGKVIIGSMDLKGVQLEVAVNALIGSMLRNGYLSSLTNSVLVSVDSQEGEYSSLAKLVSDEITLKLKESQIEASVVAQWLDETTELEELAAKYGISLGKAQLIKKIIANSVDENYTEDDLARLTINELNIILSGLSITEDDLTQSGTASAQKYIGKDRALEVAFSKVESGLTQENVLGLNAKLDFNDGIMVWEVEFYYGTNEYEFEIGAITGEIVSFEREISEYVPDATQPTKTNDELKAIALERAGVTEVTDVTINIEKCWFWGAKNSVYSVWFEYENTYYEFEIDVYGSVLYSFEQKLDVTADQLMSRKAEDLRAFLESQGELSSLQNVRNLRVVTQMQTDEESGESRLVYIVTFSVDEVKYTYTIDPLNETILNKSVEERKDSIKDWFGDKWDDDWDEMFDDDYDDDWEDFFEDWGFHFDEHGGFGGKKPNNQSTATVLTEEEIKSYLLNQLRGQFGLILLEDTTEWEIELDEERGGGVYEVEFKWNNREFECDVDAFTGMLIRGTWDYVDGYTPEYPSWHHAK